MAVLLLFPGASSATGAGLAAECPHHFGHGAGAGTALHAGHDAAASTGDSLPGDAAAHCECRGACFAGGSVSLPDSGGRLIHSPLIRAYRSSTPPAEPAARTIAFLLPFGTAPPRA